MSQYLPKIHHNRNLLLILIFSLMLPALQLFTPEVRGVVYISRTTSADWSEELAGAVNAGLIPPNISGNLSKAMTYGDYLEFMRLFIPQKFGIALESTTGRVPPGLSLSELFAVGDIISDFQSRVQGLTAPLSPYRNGVFCNIPVMVFHEDYLLRLLVNSLTASKDMAPSSLMSLNLSSAVPCDVFAVFIFRFACESLPLDRSGVYPGALSGIGAYDDHIERILNEAIEPWMDKKQQVRAIHDYMALNFRHSAFIISANNDLSAITGGDLLNPLLKATMDAHPLFADGEAYCTGFASAMLLFLLRLGLEANLISGIWINRNGDLYEHDWNQVKLDGEWYWLDVNAERINYQDIGAITHFTFMQHDDRWTYYHDWDHNKWPAADGSKHEANPPRLAALPYAAPSSWAVQTVQEAIAAGIVPGYLQQDYTKAITRSEFCSFAVRLYELLTGETITEVRLFADSINIDVGKAATIKVVSGTGENEFSPDLPLTREAAAVMIARLSGILGKPIPANAAVYSDLNSVSSWALPDVGRVQGVGIMGYMDAGNFGPLQAFSREQAVIVMMRLYGYLENE